MWEETRCPVKLSCSIDLQLVILELPGLELLLKHNIQLFVCAAHSLGNAEPSPDE